ncbi:DUF2294 family protein [Planomicrobium chinense]|uniref:DUF2294 domain-containing protein n=1 Tax=Planococcus chinensis TaxID=272917 RepID=UPI001CC64860|nr:Na-translocating system protein MpsC family protein [Planococcus chinensis]MBZ5199739.1 DUF2294 family protein [Planococcus chinensis]
MPKEKTMQSEIGGYLSTLLRTHFGKGPTSVYVTIARPFIAIHLRGFLAPTERILVEQQEWKRVLETRDLLMNELKQEIKLNLWKIAELDVKEVYADWHLEQKTGMIFVVLNEEEEQKAWQWPEDVDEEDLYRQVKIGSIEAQKEPEETYIYWLNDRTVLIRRFGILLQLEKELIKNGFEEQLKIAKRPVEYTVVAESNIQQSLKRNILETFVDWNFEKDIGYMILVLESLEKQQK